MVQAIHAFLDFCYLVRRNSHTTDTLQQLDAALDRFNALRVVFEELGVRPNGFNLPRQHSLVHYVRGIQLFGSPNGLCSSITESRHITAVKKPWRRSNRSNALQQMLETNTRLSKLAAARAEFARRGMLRTDVLTAARIAAGIEDEEDADREDHDRQVGADVADDEGDVGEHQGPAVTSFFRLPKRHSKSTSMYV